MSKKCFARSYIYVLARQHFQDKAYVLDILQKPMQIFLTCPQMSNSSSVIAGIF